MGVILGGCGSGWAGTGCGVGVGRIWGIGSGGLNGTGLFMLGASGRGHACLSILCIRNLCK